jgi:hypothetical protein
MANSKSSGNNYEYATVDTNPGASGYWTNEVSIRHLQKTTKRGSIFFSIREYEADSSQASDTSVATVKLQFKCEGDLGWQDYKLVSGVALEAGHRITINDTGAGVRWRAGVKDGGFTSGKVIFGFDW